MHRKSFIKWSLGASMGALSLPHLALRNQDHDPLSSELVKEFVTVGHSDLDKVKSMLLDHPNLLYSSYDWGHGDFELAIEGAGHVGNKDIANYLIEKGARPNIFVLTMLGKTDIVKNMLADYPSLLRSKGPHGFSLLHHANVGGDDASELLEFIEQQGLKEKNFGIK